MIGLLDQLAPYPLMSVRIPGEPVAQGRPRFSTRGGFVRAIDPAKSRHWKAAARDTILQALKGGQIRFPRGPVEVHILAVFSCPPSQFRRRNPWPRRPHTKRPDIENVGKAVLDACTGLVFSDDSQVDCLVIEKVIGAQGEAPYVELLAWGTTPEGGTPMPAAS